MVVPGRDGARVGGGEDGGALGEVERKDGRVRVQCALGNLYHQFAPRVAIVQHVHARDPLGEAKLLARSEHLHAPDLYYAHTTHRHGATGDVREHRRGDR